jgi:hypothetical protein
MNDHPAIERVQEGLHSIGLYVRATKALMELGHEVTPEIDREMIGIARRVSEQDGALFNVIDPKYLVRGNRPDAINHQKTLLAPNRNNRIETVQTLDLVDVLLRDQVTEIKAKFAEAFGSIGLLDRIVADPDRPGAKFILPSNHLQLADQGFSIGMMHKVANEHGLDSIENHITAVIGRVVGYFEFNGQNVIDGILRKVCSVLKTFPVAGSESMTDEERVLTLVRRAFNDRTQVEFNNLVNSREGNALFVAPSGEQDKYDPLTNIVTMSRFGRGTCQMMIDACSQGAEVVPLFVDYDYDLMSDAPRSLVRVLEPRVVGSIQDCHDIGEEIAAAGREEREAAVEDGSFVKRFSASITYQQAA